MELGQEATGECMRLPRVNTHTVTTPDNTTQYKTHPTLLLKTPTPLKTLLSDLLPIVLRSSALEVLPETSAKVEALLAAVEETQVIKLDVPEGEDWADLVAAVSDLTPGERYCCVARSEEGPGSDPSASA